MTEMATFESTLPKEEQILRQLPRYLYLTTKHMIKLGIATSGNNVNPHLKSLRDSRRNLIGYLEGDGNQKEYFYYLTKRGEDFIINNLDIPSHKIKRPVGRNSQLKLDHTHRFHFINCMIDLYNAMDANEFEMELCDYYYEYEGRASKAKVKLKRGDIVPDCIFAMTKAKDQKLYRYMYCLEYERKPQIKEIKAKLDLYLQAFKEKQPMTKYNYPNMMRVLYVFDTEKKMQSVIQRIKEDPRFNGAAAYFLFKYAEQTVDFFNGWTTFDDKVVRMF